MMTMDYRDTLIAVAEDSPVRISRVPRPHGGRKTLALIQYELIEAHPYEFTSAQLLFESHMRHKGVSEAELKRRRSELWETFFKVPQACLRASALPKKYGFGIHCDGDGRVALVPLESPTYEQLSQSKTTKTLKALRSRRGS